MNETTTPPAVMEDFVFGRLEADETTLATERSRWTGIRHGHAIAPLDPLPGQPVTLAVTAGRDVLIDRMTAYVTTDGSEPAGRRGAAANGVATPLQRRHTVWQPLYWDYAEIWQGTIPGQAEGAHVRYRIEGWHSRLPQVSHWAAEMNIDGTVEQPALYGYVVDRFQAPDWAHTAVVYQIFVDRFAPVSSRWLEPQEMERFIGGSLAGVIERLDYIAELGATAIWLTPIFACQSYHGYDTTDYYRVDPRFGSNEDLAELVRQAHARGLRVILDFVANHIGHTCTPFQEALREANSPYRQWFSFDQAYPHGYRTFFTSRTMPQLNLDHPEARAYLLDAAAYWLAEYGVDGYRLDYAAGPSHDFWSAFGAACKRVNPECWLFGEVTMGSEWLRTYAGRLDGCLDFSFTRFVRRLCTRPYAAANTRLSQFVASIQRGHEFFPASFTRPTFIDNHDMNRFLPVAGDDKRRLRLAAGLLLGLGNTPILYYGTEVGLSQPRAKGPHREESRHPMLWGATQDAELLATFRQLIAFRRRHPALARGAVETLALEDAQGWWLGQRAWQDDVTLVAVNCGDAACELPLPAGAWVSHQDGSGGLDGSPETIEGLLHLPPLSVMLLAPR